MDFTDQQLERYSRQLILMDIGGPGQSRLLESRIAIVGAGGLGVPVMAYLAAVGVGAMTIIDHDTIELSNLQRQIAYTLDDLGEPKAEAAARFIRARNPDVQVDARLSELAQDTAHLLDNHDLIIDCCDRFETRFLVNRLAIERRIPLVSGALGTFEGQLSSYAPWRGDDLPCYRCLVPDLPPADLQRTCSDQGILGTVAGVIGTLQAQEAVKMLLNLGEPLLGKLLIVDTLASRQRVITLPRDPKCPDCSTLARAA